MFGIDNILLKSLFIYLLSCYILYSIKHPVMFDEKDDFKCFGLNKKETIYPFWLVTSLIGITSYYLFRVTDNLD